MLEELDRLLKRGLTPDEEVIARRYYSQKEREGMDADAFCGPHRSFPITSQEDVHNAASLLHHADNPSAVKSCIRGKAKAHGWSLPSTWESGDTEKVGTEPDILRGQHGAMTGKHAHPHPAAGDQGSDESHDHPHSHNNDNDHSHDHPDGQEDESSDQEEPDDKDTKKANTPEITRADNAETTIYAPILRYNPSKREVVVRATAEAMDSYQTVIGFEASKAAFQNWRGNIREMHDPTKAVGRSIKWEPLENEKAIDLTLMISRGAEDTWQKVLDGTLTGASIGARNGKWGKKSWQGKEVPFLERYDLVEVSLVDNPSCPGCEVKIVRANGVVTEALEVSEEEIPEESRRGARVSSNTMTSLHKSRDHALQSVREILGNCPCDDCQSALSTLDPDGDGDIDLVPSLDTDSDRGGAGEGDGSGVMKATQAEIIRVLAPYVERMNAIASRLSSISEPELSPEITRRLDTVTQTNPDTTRRLDALEQKLNGLDEVRSALAEVKGLAERIAAQPQTGGPIVNPAAMRGMTPQPDYDQTALEAEVIARLSRSGILNKDQQVNAVMYLQKLQQQGASSRR